MVDKILLDELSWEEKAKWNPFFSIMPMDEYLGKSPNPEDWKKEDLERFLEKGKFIYEAFIRPVILKNGFSRGSSFIVEYGSGMGRILKAVREDGYDCAGIDISQTMLEKSRKLVPEVQSLYLLGEDARCEIPDASADFVFTYTVLQHIRLLSKLRTAIAEMCRILKVGGILQLQFRCADPPFKARHPISKLKRLKMHYTIRRVLNLERRSVFIMGVGPGKLQLFPFFRVVKHTNWVGVHLSYYLLKKYLKENGISLLAIERPINIKNPNFAWALGVKMT